MSHKHQSSVCLCNLLVRSCSLWDASGFLSGLSLNVECIKWVGTLLPTPTEAEWDFLNLHLLTAVNNSRRKKRKHLHCWYGERLEYDGRAELPLTLILKQLLCSCILKNSCVCFFFSLSLCPSRSLKSRVKIMVDGTLLISSLIPEDSGNYTCMPTNGLPNPPTASANLTVMRTLPCVVCSREPSKEYVLPILPHIVIQTLTQQSLLCILLVNTKTLALYNVSIFSRE